MTDLQSTLQERNSRYGDFTDHARIAQDLTEYMRDCPGWARLDHVKRQSLTVIADKIARILNGDPNYIDSFRDICGYATLVMQRLEVQVGATDTKTTLIIRTEDGWLDASEVESGLQKHEGKV